MAYIEAIRSCFDLEVDLEGYSTSGKTDLLILQDLLKREGVQKDKINLVDVANSYLLSLKRTVTRDPGKILPGVVELLKKLDSMDEVYLALGTGNLEEAARVKLRVHKLNAYFPVGGYGSDAPRRADLIAAGIRKASEHYRTDFTITAVIGDTPFDIEAAARNKVHSLAVATGPYGMRALQKAGATLVLRDLQDIGGFLKSIYSLPSN